MSKINISPKKFQKDAVAVTIEVRGFQLNSKSGTAVAIFSDEDGHELKRERVDIPEEIFTQWGTDDSIIENYVLQQLQLTKQ